MEISEIPTEPPQRSLDPFRRAVVRGLGVLLPPLLTIFLFLWVGNWVATYCLWPMEGFVRARVVNAYQENVIKPGTISPDMVHEGKAEYQGILYQKIDDGSFIPVEHYEFVLESLGSEPMPKDSRAIYEKYVSRKLFPPYVVWPLFLLVFLLVLYLLGRFLAVGVGRFIWMQIERLISRLPLVRNVYSSVKQVTDFLFNEREIEYTRVVAVEYPRKGIWTMAMVTGESLLDIRCAANEPVLSVLIPTSPMPFTGFTVTVKRSETIDLNITIDQAFQFIVSCGVVVPPHQISQAIADSEIRGEIAGGAEPGES